jgi:phage tail protein X
VLRAVRADVAQVEALRLVDLLTISPAAVSGVVRYLLQVELVKRERDPGSRRDHYRVLDEVWQEAIFNRDKVLARWETNLAEGVELLGPDTPAGRRLNESVRMFQFLRRELKGTQERWIAERDARPGDHKVP